MKIQIEKPIEVQTDRNFDGLNAIIETARAVKTMKEFDSAIQTDFRIQDQDFFIYFGSSHIAIHEVLPNGENSERLLFIS